MEPTIQDFEDLFGYEFDWFAVDTKGAVALFSTAGYGEIPVAVMRYKQQHDQIAAQIPLPNFNTLAVWKDYARQGLFVFDWKYHTGPYIKMEPPIGPPNATLHEQIRRIPELPVLDLVFRTVTQVKIERFQARESK